MHFCDHATVRRMFAGKTVALVGSGPGSLDNRPGLVDSHDVVVRVNNYKLFPATGYRADVYYSFFGRSIKKSAEALKRDGVKLCIAKCPNAQFMESAWHRQNGKMNGVDFRYIYELRADFWFCDTYVPTVDEFLRQFEVLGNHVPTTGFSALLAILACEPRHVYMTGFDFFKSKVHNVNEAWRQANPSDPIGHVPATEADWLARHASGLPLTMDAALTAALAGDLPSAAVQTVQRIRKFRGIRV